MKFSEIVRKVGSGTLPLEHFRYYVMQDSYYLSHFARVQSLGAAKALDLHTTNRMASHTIGTYEAELGLHKNFSKLLGITEEEKMNFKPAPTAYAYTSHLYRAAYTGHLGTPDEPIYQQWIGAYGGEWFRTLVEEQIDRFDEIADSVTDIDRERMKEHFMISSEYEYAFWEMAYQLEEWPVQKNKRKI
jgi:thiaminase/transcriptional activator TenA